MGRKRVVTKRPGYKEAVFWIAHNDNDSDCLPLDCTDGGMQRELRERISRYITTALVADLFGATTDAVAHDVFRERHKPSGPTMKVVEAK